MRDYPTEMLDPKVKTVWRISHSIGITLAFWICILCFFVIYAADEQPWELIVLCVLVIAWIACMIIWVIVLPSVRYNRWRYNLSEDFLEIAYGIIWRRRFMIPFIRVQNTDTVQGPLLRMVGLSAVTISTAAGSHQIPGLDQAQADIVRDRAAELARLAREDV